MSDSWQIVGLFFCTPVVAEMPDDDGVDLQWKVNKKAVRGQGKAVGGQGKAAGGQVKTVKSQGKAVKGQGKGRPGPK